MNGSLWKGQDANIFWIKEDITYLQRKSRKIYSSPKPFVKMKPNKLLATRIMISIHARTWRVVKLKYAWYQLVDDILLKRNYDNHLWPKCIQAYVTRCHYCHKSISLSKKDAMPLHYVTIEHPSKQGKLNRVGKIFPDLFELHKYTLITAIFFMGNDVEASKSFQSNILINFVCSWNKFLSIQLIVCSKPFKGPLSNITNTNMIGWHAKLLWARN